MLNWLFGFLYMLLSIFFLMYGNTFLSLVFALLSIVLLGSVLKKELKL